MIIGIVFSLLLIIYQTSRPYLASLGRVPGVPGAYSDLSRHPENIPVPGILILRLDAPIYYANALTVRDKVNAMIEEAQPAIHAVIFDASGQYKLDITSVEMLKGLVRELNEKDISVYTAEVHEPVREFGRRSGLLSLIGEERMFPTVEEAVSYIESSTSLDVNK